MLAHIKEILNKAVKGRYAVGAFNVNNLEILQAVLGAAAEMSSPVIIQTTEGAIKYAGLKELAALVKAAAGNVKVPVALHLDHGHDIALIKKAIGVGYSSVMIDASDKEYRENVKLVKMVVKYAHKRGVSVQAELGRLEGAEDWLKVGRSDGYFTDPEEAACFVRETGIDTFAPAIGNYHGVEKITQNKILKLDLTRLAEIAKVINVPLVLHGASGFSEAEIKRAIKLGIRVINIDSDLRVSFANAEREFFLKNKNIFDPRKILSPAIRDMKRVVKKKIKIFGSGVK